MGRRLAIIGLVLAALLGACTFPPLVTPTPRPTPTPTDTPATPSPSPTPTATVEPTPVPVAPDYRAGDIVATSIDGLRVRGLPGIDRPIVTGLLPFAFELVIIMGPIPVDGLAWYLVADADARDPNFDEGWVAAGYEPDPLLVPTGRIAESAPYVVSMATTGDAEQGPIEIGEGDHAIRWIALDPERRRCTFALSLSAAGGGEPVPAIRATVGTGVDRGTLQPQSFAAIGLRGPVFASVTSDCAWALTILRVPYVPTPTPDPTP